jgi:type I restriction enzyme S subunit
MIFDKLSDICEVIDSLHKTPKYSDVGKPMVRCTDVKYGELNLANTFRVSDEVFAEFSKRYSPQIDDIIITRVGSYGITAQVKDTNFCLGQNTSAVKPKGINPDYLYLVLNSKIIKNQIEFSVVGSTQKTLSLKAINNLDIPRFGSDIEDKIASVGASLDDKVVNNIQTNRTLEEMAQAIFKSWFVDFDPVKAKMNGEQPEGMDEATASLFPEKLDNETGIPVGWSQGVIADIAKLNAKSWTKKNQPEQVHYVDLANTKNGVIETVTSYDFSEAPSRARRILNSGDTIVGTVRPGNRSFAFIGDTEQPLTGSTGFAVLSPKEECWTSYVYLATTNDDSIDEYARLADGGAYPAIKPVVVADTPCAIPTKDIAQKFWQLTGSMLKKAHQNRLENEELAKLRDTLLPKLLSGEIELETK